MRPTKTLSAFAAAGAVLSALTLGLPAPASAQDLLPRILLDQKPGNEKRFTPSSAQVTISRSKDAPAASAAIDIQIQPGVDAFPGIALKPESGVWDLSQYGHVEAQVVNTGKEALNVSLRIDNDGDWRDNPWNAEMATIPPGQTGTVKVVFGRSFGFQKGFKLKPNAIVNLLLFTTKTDAPRSFRIESLMAAGKPGEGAPVTADNLTIRPKGESLLEGESVGIDTQHVNSSLKAGKLEALFSIQNSNASLAVRPAAGRWDLRDRLEVRAHVKNTGKTPVAPMARIETKGGPSEWAFTDRALDPGQEGDIVIPFLSGNRPDLGKPVTLPKMGSDAVSAVTFMLSPASGVTSGQGVTTDRPIEITSLRAVMPPPPALPDWLGKRPPVPGDWTNTLDDEFDGTTLNTTLWDPTGENYYDKVTHWSKEDVIVGGGVARLRYEKKTGFHNDDPKRNKSDYAAGYLNGYKLWAQRYGYFESRMKLPRAPGLWPAFWMMPDRGPDAKDRQTTSDSGMEFDIMEHLTRWGPTRYNIAMHYDGYEKDHKAIGSDRIYVQPDKDGFLTCGLLWTPGLAVYYCNGREVLRWENPRISSVPSTIMFTLPSGGWDNDDLDDDKLPADFIIDYVRVWQRKDLASPADRMPAMK